LLISILFQRKAWKITFEDRLTINLSFIFTGVPYPIAPGLSSEDNDAEITEICDRQEVSTEFFQFVHWKAE
jgi:hypothetical protein